MHIAETLPLHYRLGEMGIIVFLKHIYMSYLFRRWETVDINQRIPVNGRHLVHSTGFDITQSEEMQNHCYNHYYNMLMTYSDRGWKILRLRIKAAIECIMP